MQIKLILSDKSRPVSIEAGHVEELVWSLRKEYGLECWVNLYCNGKIIGWIQIFFDWVYGLVVSSAGLPPALQKFFDGVDYLTRLRHFDWDIKTEGYLEFC